MATQAQIYPDCSGFPPFIPPEFAGGGGGSGGAVWGNPQGQQFLGNKSSEETSSFYSLDSQFVKHSFEIDHFIVSQNERLMQVLREQRNRDVSELLKNIEARTSFILHQKHEQLAGMKTRNSQLESLLMKLQTDMLTWKQVAKQNELHVISLKNTIEKLHQSNDQAALVEDTESACCDDRQQQQQQQQQKQRSGGVDKIKMVCRVCERREVGVVMLPCRHMCACSVCNPMIDLCPVCRMAKKGSVEVRLCFPNS